MKQDERVKKRIEEFEIKANTLELQGYRRVPLLINIVTANIVAIVAMIPIFGISLYLYFTLYGFESIEIDVTTILLFCIVTLLLTVVHEGLHGITWGHFCENGMASIEYGIIWKLLTPYCTCKEPLKKHEYIIGALMPGIVLGIIPLIIGLATGYYYVMMMGVVMTIAATGDAMIVVKLLRYKGDAIFMDHPSEGGLIAFERK